MATIKTILDTRRSKKDGTFPVVIRVRHQEKYFDIPTSYSVLEKKFDGKRERLIDNTEANFYLEELKEQYSKRIRDFFKDNISTAFDINDLKKCALQKPTNEVTLKEFWDEHIKELENRGSAGNARAFRIASSCCSSDSPHQSRFL